jgi:hypothetical protein
MSLAFSSTTTKMCVRVKIVRPLQSTQRNQPAKTLLALLSLNFFSKYFIPINNNHNYFILLFVRSVCVCAVLFFFVALCNTKNE